MGCDGGTIPKRHELVKTAKRGEQKDKDMERKSKWSTCSITQQPLETPIMVCELGRLYSKESVLEHLLDQSVNDTCGHVTSMKDVKEVTLTPNPGYSMKTKGSKGDQYYDHQLSKYVCPVVGLEMNGKYKFCVLWSCGCVLSERALKEVESDTCHSCGGKFEKDDIIVIYPDPDDLSLMEDNMKLRKEKWKAARKEKKSKKSKRKLEEVDGHSTLTSETNGDVEKPSMSKKKVNGDHKFDVPKLPITVVDAHKITSMSTSTSSSTSTKLKKKDKESGTSSSSSSSSKTIDPKKTNVYKSLFTSGQKVQDKDKTAHWITYNPYHL